jgi:hypothetical protein
MQTAGDFAFEAPIATPPPVIATPIADLMPRAFAIAVAHMVTIYDSLYVALAETRDIPLVTADERLIRRLSGDVALAKLLVWVGDLPVGAGGVSP